MRPTWRVASRPIAVKVLPPSTDLKTPQPGITELRGFASPVPIQTIELSEGAIATSPIEAVGPDSKTGAKVMPLFSVRQRPPLAAATKKVLGRRGSTARSLMRPPMFTGPSARQCCSAKRSGDQPASAGGGATTGGATAGSAGAAAGAAGGAA